MDSYGRTPAVIDISMSDANLPYPIGIPDGIKRLRIFTRHISAVFRISYVNSVNNVSSPLWWEVKLNQEYVVDHIDTREVLLWTLSDTANAGLAIEYWT